MNILSTVLIKNLIHETVRTKIGCFLTYTYLLCFTGPTNVVHTMTAAVYVISCTTKERTYKIRVWVHGVDKM